MTHKRKQKKQKPEKPHTIADQIKNTLSDVFVVWRTANGEAPATGTIYGIFSTKEIAEKMIESEKDSVDYTLTYGVWKIDYRWHNQKPLIKYWKPISAPDFANLEERKMNGEL